MESGLRYRYPQAGDGGQKILIFPDGRQNNAEPGRKNDIQRATRFGMRNPVRHEYAQEPLPSGRNYTFPLIPYTYASTSATAT
jgi:hypothetical protein